MNSDYDLCTLYNGLVETAVRNLVILDAIYPRAITLDELRLIDFFVVHAGDIDAGESLHAAIPARGRAYDIREPGIQAALAFLQEKKAIYIDRTGIWSIQATADSIKKCLFSTYLTSMWSLAHELIGADVADTKVRQHFKRMSKKLPALMKGEPDCGDRKLLLHLYACDIQRMSGLVDGIGILSRFEDESFPLLDSYIDLTRKARLEERRIRSQITSLTAHLNQEG